MYFFLYWCYHPHTLQDSVSPVYRISYKTVCINKLDGVGPVDNIPYTKQLQHFLKKREKKEIYIYIYYVSHLTCDT